MIVHLGPAGDDTGGGVHALLIGISQYPYLPDGTKSDEGQDYDLGMRQLNSPALSAVRIACWLLREQQRLPRKLASLRLLIAPSAGERTSIAQLDAESEAEQQLIAACASSSADDCTWERVKTALHQWRSDCATGRSNIAWFYFGGHGIQQVPEEPIMLLSGFNARDNPVLGEALSFQHILRGMEVTVDFKKMAAQQHFIVDACRTQYAALARLFDEAPRKPWSYQRDAIGQRDYATVFGTSSGAASFGTADGTVLSQALLRALQGEAADAEQDDASNRIWNVKHFRLLEVLHELVSQIAKGLKKSQTSQPGPTSGNVIWSKTFQAPILPVSIELDPPTAHPPETLCLQRADSNCERTSVELSTHPYTAKVEAGHYSVCVTFPPGHAFRSYLSQYLLYARPPRATWRVAVARTEKQSATDEQSGTGEQSDTDDRADTEDRSATAP